MNGIHKLHLRALLAGVVLLLASAGAQAQATRTWVSGVGDDINPCSRTAPCKTFAGAISKTAAGGIINVIDSGGFGYVTITKSITIDGEGAMAGISASGVSGVTVNGAGIDVVLRNLQINGAAPSGTPAYGNNGVRFLNGASLHIENCHISNFRFATAYNGNGVMVEPTAAGTYRIYISDSTISNNGWGDDGGGVRLRHTGASTFVFATITNSKITNNNGYGVLSRDRGFVSISGANISGNQRSGVQALTTGTIGDILVRDSVLVDNGAGNPAADASVTSSGTASYVTLEGNTVAQSEAAIRRVGGGHIASTGDNRMVGNTANGTTDGSVTSL